MMLASFFNTLDPVILRLTESLAIKWYGVSYIAGFIAGWLILFGLSRRGRTPIPPDRTMDVILALVMGTVVGGRLGYVFFYQPSLLWQFTGTPPWWGVLAINQGGMASHGGMIGIVIACWWVSRGFKDDRGVRVGASPFLHVADLAAFIATPGLFFGRLANFVNGELLGRIVSPPGEPGPWWAVKYPQELGTRHAPALSPEQSAKLDALLDSVAKPGDSTERALDRLLAKVQSGSTELARELEPLIAARHPSQLYQALGEGLLLGMLLVIVWLRPRRPGVVMGAFLLGYGVQRIIIEHFWRLPDPQLTNQYILGLTRGQLLSVGMLAAGAAVLAIARAQRTPPMGGLLASP